MRDIARNFQAPPLVSWIVWMAMAAIVAPVMALPAAAAGGSDEMSPVADAAMVPSSENPGDNIEDPRNVTDDGAVANPIDESAPVLLVQENANEPTELAEPSDSFSFDEMSVGTPEDGVLAPLSITESSDGGDGELVELGDGPLTPPSLKLQTAAIQEGDDFSARARIYGHYFLESNIAVVGAVDLSTGNAFSDTDSTGFNVSELYIVAAPPDLPSLRGAVGLIELTSFFDRNSFAKDSLTHFINPV
ncbi:MAG: hypothetical protein AAF282_18360, partial [Cyanobacteria bacterium P01_A01_bin.15]